MYLFTDSRGFPISIQVYSGNTKSIQEESEVDGFYVIRTNIPSEEREASDIVRDYKCLADVEKSFRTIKTTLLLRLFC
ncbi:MAG: hypothetical protein LBP87_13270 [Planctomycetaceae bacterium]|nr:hypothetical protein [Planctomycetaceae bacterium]